MKITSLPNDIDLLKKMILKNNYRLELKSRELKEKRLEIESREMIISDQRRDINDLGGKVESQCKYIKSLDEKIEDQGREIKSLGNEVELKEGIIGEKERQVKSREQEIKDCQEIIRLLQRKKYAPQSEIVSSRQLGLFNELEDIIDSEKKENKDEKETITYTRRKRKRRPRIPDCLPRIDKVIELSEDERICSNDGKDLKEIGEEVSESLEIIPAQVKVIRMIRKKYACPACRKEVKTAPLPPSILPKSIASPSMISYIATSKYEDALPLYRQEKIFDRIGVVVPRQTMARWLIEISEQLIPIYNLLQDKLLEGDYIQMDETTVQVLKEKGKKATSKSYMWVRHLPGDRPIVLFDYAPRRDAGVPKKLLAGFKGYLQCDGYVGYDQVCEENDLIRLGCMDHCRRKFFDAYKASGKRDGVGKRGPLFLKKLYKIEEEITGAPIEVKQRERETRSVEILNEMKEWIDDIRSKLTPNSLSGKAINYAFNEWAYLTRYTTNGFLNISNAWIENKIRPFCVGRRNWLFSDTVRGAESSALYYSLMVTSRANGLEPFDYFNKMLENLPYAQTVEDYEQLLPLQGVFAQRPSFLGKI